MLTYGLTGGIGTGKSTVAKMFLQLGFPVFDADELGRQLLCKGTDLTREVIRRIPDCADTSGQIDRKSLAEKVFSEPESRRFLEDLLHPAIREEFRKQKSQLPRPLPPFCLIEGAVFSESRTDFELDGLIVVTAPMEIRLRRLQQRDGTDESLHQRISAQLPQHEKIRAATHIIDNSGGLSDTRRQVEAVAAILTAENGEVA